MEFAGTIESDLPARRAGVLQGALLALCYGAQAFATIGIVPILPRLAQEYGSIPHGEMLVSLIISITPLMMAIFSPIVGYAASRIGGRHILIGGLILYAASAAGGFIAHELYAIIAARAVSGVALAAMIVSSSTLIAQHFTGEARNRWIGLQMLALSLMMIVASLLSGWLGDFAWRGVFLLPVLPLLLLPFLLGALRDVTPDYVHREGPNDGEGEFPLRAALGVCAACAIFSTILYGPALSIGFLLGERGAASTADTGYALSLMAICGIPASSAFAAMSNFSLKSRMGISTLLALLALAALNIEGSKGVFISAAFTGSAMSFGMATMFAWMIATASFRFAASALGMLQPAIYLGQFAAPLLAVTLLPIVGSWLAAMLCFLGMALFLLGGVLFFVRK